MLESATLTSPPRADYAGGGAANLMTTLRHALAPGMGVGTVPASTLLDPACIRDARHVILLVIDGLGSRQLHSHAPAGFMASHQLAEMSAVFPSTTASAISTYLSAEPPAVHGLLGWHLWLPSLGVIAAPLPFSVRGAGVSLSQFQLSPRSLFTRHHFFPAIQRQARVIHPRHLADTPYTQAHTAGARSHPFEDLEGLFREIVAVSRGGECDFSYAYWPELDALSHIHGSLSEQAGEHLRIIDEHLARTGEALAGSGTLLLVSADHGFVDTTRDTRIALSSHPELASMLLMPLSGEPRSAICHVRRAARTDFESYVRERLGHACWLRCSEDLVAEGHFGPSIDAHPELMARLGDFMLLMKDDYCIVDRLPGERPFNQIGVHGGMSTSELRVPLIRVQG